MNRSHAAFADTAGARFGLVLALTSGPLMHRTIEISLSSPGTDALLDELERDEDVIGLSVNRSASIKPEGDVVTVHVLNRGADRVFQIADKAQKGGATISLATSELASLVDPDHALSVENDVDEGQWEEMEAGLRHHGRITANFLALMFLGGCVASVALVESPVHQAVGFVAAAMISPGYEPLAKVPLGLVLGKGRLVRRGLQSALAGYAMLVVGAALMFGLLRALNVSSPELLAHNPGVLSLSHPDARSIAYSVLGGLTGMIVVAAYRRSVLAGPLVLLAIIPAAALIGASLAAGNWPHVEQAAGRLLLDVVIIWATGALVLAWKRALVHKRNALV